MSKENPYNKHNIDHQSKSRLSWKDCRHFSSMLRDLVGSDQAEKIAKVLMKKSLVNGQIDPKVLSDHLERAVAQYNPCACGSCNFRRTQANWINSQLWRIEHEEMSKKMIESIQETITFETGRMRRVSCALHLD